VISIGSGYGSTLMSFAQSYNVFGEVSSASSPESSQAYAYDGAARLTGVGDNFEGSCTTRTYALDGDSNRTSFTSAATTPVGGVCPVTNTAGATSTSTFDTTASGQGGSDRIVSSTWGSNTGNYAYDALGRQTTLPSVDTGTGGSTTSGNVTLTYRADDMVNSMSQGSACMNYTYDPSDAVVTTSNFASSTCTGTATSTATNYYNGGGSPAWTVNTVGSNTSTTSYFSGITQGNAMNVTAASTGSSCLGDASASCTLNLTDLRGDIIATAIITSGTATVSGYSAQTEFGQARSQATQNAVAPLYGWLGVHQKAENNLSGLVLMGARVYNPTAALFSASDPVYGGNANPYTYPSDPVNQFDFGGDRVGGIVRGVICSVVLVGSSACGFSRHASTDMQPEERISKDFKHVNRTSEEDELLLREKAMERDQPGEPRPYRETSVADNAESSAESAVSSSEDHPSVWSWGFWSKVIDDGGLGSDDDG